MISLKDGYGYGLFQFPFYDDVSYGHTGGIDGFRSIYSHDSKNNISYALLSNGVNMNLNDISIAVLSAVYHKPYDIPTFTSYEITSEELEPYLGVYASQQIPLKITITKEKNTLIGQGTGQAAFPLEAFEKDKFKFEQAGIILEFEPENNAMILIQGGGKIKFTKE